MGKEGGGGARLGVRVLVENWGHSASLGAPVSRMSSLPTSARRVVITGLGAVTPCGLTAAATWDALAAGRSGIGRITRFDATGCNAQIADRKSTRLNSSH